MPAFIRCLLCLALAILPLTLRAQYQTNTFSFNNVDVAIPDDGGQGGVQTSESVSGVYGSIYSIQISIDLVGTPTAYDGDYFMDIFNSSGQGFAVLLNRSGVASFNSPVGYGYGNNGYDITFSDTALHDIHFYQDYSPSYNGSGQLTGVWQPDGENISPTGAASTFDNAESDQTAMLGSFDGQSPDSTWSLYMADLSPGGTGELATWSMTIVTAPEPTTIALLAGGVMLAGLRWRKHLVNHFKA